MFVQIQALIIKEFLAVWRDKSTRAILILPPLLQLLLFAFAITLEVKDISLAVYNQDLGKDSYELIQRFKGSPQFSDILYLEKESDINQTMDQGQAILTLQIPADFSRKIRQGEQATLQALLDGRRSNSSFIVLGYVNQIVDSYNRETQTLQRKPQNPTQVITRHWYNPNLEYMWYTIPCLVGILSMMIALVLTALSIAREREMGTFDQLLVSPLTPMRIIIGKIIPALILAMMEGSIILFFAIIAFDVPFNGSFITLYSSMLIFLFAVIGIGLFISSLCKTQQQAVLWTFTFLSPAIMISGFATPVENNPIYLQYISDAIPLKHFLIVLKGSFLKDMPPSAVWDHTWPNLVIAFFTLTTAVWLFKNRLE